MKTEGVNIFQEGRSQKKNKSLEIDDKLKIFKSNALVRKHKIRKSIMFCMEKIYPWIKKFNKNYWSLQDVLMKWNLELIIF